MLEPVRLLLHFGPLVALLSGPVVSEMIKSETPGKKKTCKYTARQRIGVFYSDLGSVWV